MKIIDNNKDLKSAGIYKITNLATGKIYVGSSKKLIQRYKSHCRDLKRGCHRNEYLQHSYSKHGSEFFIFEIVEIIEDVASLTIVEQHYIDSLDCCNKGIGYNISPRADRPGVLAEESRRKISEYRKANPWTPEQIEKSRIARIGKKHTEEHKKLISEGCKKTFKNMTDDQKRKFNTKMKEVFNTDVHRKRLRAQSDKINHERMKVSDEYTLSEIVLKYIASKSLVSTAVHFNMSKSALSRIFKKINGEFPVLYREILSKINFEGSSITDLHVPEIQAKLTLHTRNI